MEHIDIEKQNDAKALREQVLEVDNELKMDDSEENAALLKILTSCLIIKQNLGSKIHNLEVLCDSNNVGYHIITQKFEKKQKVQQNVLWEIIENRYKIDIYGQYVNLMIDKNKNGTDFFKYALSDIQSSLKTMLEEDKIEVYCLRNFAFILCFPFVGMFVFVHFAKNWQHKTKGL